MEVFIVSQMYVIAVKGIVSTTVKKACYAHCFNSILRLCIGCHEVSECHCHFLAIYSPACQNVGVCSQSDVCDCPNRYS